MGITHVDKILSEERIDCDGILNVTLSVTAQPDVVNNPVDIALVLDRSGSMTGTPMMHLKAGAKEFIDIVMKRTGGRMGRLANGNRIGIVSFAGTASIDVPLTEDVEVLKQAVDALQAQGNTNHADAFTQAGTLFGATMRKKVLVIFTDGETTVGPDPAPIAAALRDDDVEIYCIGLVGTDGLDVNALNTWASDPDSAHVAVTPDLADLEELFQELAANISKTGATGIVVNETVRSDFVITSILPPAKGTAVQQDSHSLRWTMPELGVTSSESAVLEFYIRHVSQQPGHKKVNEAITYSDNEGNIVTFPDPEVEVECNIVVHPEPCPEPVELTVEGCADTILADLGDVYLSSLGRILQLDVTVRHVCPNRRVALAAILTEVDENGMEYQRGMKTMTLPAHRYEGCRDIQVKCIQFVVPEDISENGEPEHAMCAPRKFKVRFIAHTIDTDYRCCEAVIDL